MFFKFVKKINLQVLLTLLLLLATTLSLYFMLHTQIIINTAANDKVMDRFIEQLDFKQFNLDGSLIKSIQADKATHMVYNNTSFFDNPKVIFTDSQGIPWNMQAEKAQSLHGTKIIFASGNVVVQHPTIGNHTATKINTSWMSFDQKKDFAYTNQPVTITRPDSITQGIGMTANFKKSIFKILSKAKIIYTP